MNAVLFRQDVFSSAPGPLADVGDAGNFEEMCDMYESYFTSSARSPPLRAFFQTQAVMKHPQLVKVAIK